MLFFFNIKNLQKKNSLGKKEKKEKKKKTTNTFHMCVWPPIIGEIFTSVACAIGPSVNWLVN